MDYKAMKDLNKMIQKQTEEFIQQNPSITISEKDQDRIIFTSYKDVETEDIVNKSAIHADICKFIHDLYLTKNRDYGDSMHPLFEEYGLTAFLVMFSIKINRIKSLMNKDKANYESLEDSIMDLANYALIALTELKYQAGNKKN